MLTGLVIERSTPESATSAYQCQGSSWDEQGPIRRDSDLGSWIKTIQVAIAFDTAPLILHVPHNSHEFASSAAASRPSLDFDRSWARRTPLWYCQMSYPSFPITCNKSDSCDGLLAVPDLWEILKL